MPNTAVENLSVQPIYDIHHIGPEMRERYSRLSQAIWEKIEPKDFSMWTDKAFEQVQEVKPRVLYPDSLAASDYMWRQVLPHLPMNPVYMRWDGKDSFIVAGDIANNSDFNGETNVRNAIASRLYTRSGVSTQLQQEAVLLRNSLGPTKVIEAVLRQPEIDIDSDPLAMLWGNGHKLISLPDYHCDSTARRRGMIPALFSTISETFQGYCEDPAVSREEAFYNFPQDRLALIEGTLTRFLGSTTVWRIKEYDPNDLDTYEGGIVIEDKFVSLTVEALVKEVSQAFFLQDPKERLEWIMANVHRPNFRGAL